MKTIKTFLKVAALILIFISNSSLKAQYQDRLRPSWWFGISGAANFDIFNGSIQQVNGSTLPYTFTNGYGVAPYFSIFTEYRPDPVWGFMLNLSMDMNKGLFNKSDAPAGVSTSVKTEYDFLSLEPSLRISPFSGNFYLFIGPRLSYTDRPSFDFQLSSEEERQDRFIDVNTIRFSAQVGAGYEIPLSRPLSTTQVNLSPFVAVVPYFGSEAKSIDNVMLTTIRAGIAIKIGSAPEPPMPQASMTPYQEKEVQLSVQPPAYVPSQQPVIENLPIANVVFFDNGSTEIPGRYALLSKDDAASFKEAQLRDCQKTADDRSTRQLKVYYNVLNILGDRMRRYPESTITLIGSSAGKGEEIGSENAAAVKNYLVNNFGIDESRIKVEGRSMPLVPSEKYKNSTMDVDLAKAEDNRVDIVSASKDLMIEATDNSALCLKPYDTTVIDGSAPGDARVTVIANGATGNLLFWSVDVVDEQTGNVEHFGTYGGDMTTISGATLLKGKKTGTYKIVLTGQTVLGHTVRKESSFTLKSEDEKSQNKQQLTCVLFDFDKSAATSTYEDFLTNTVAPQIPSNTTVVITGHTDTIGHPDYNMDLSIKRAKETEAILESALNKAGKTNITYRTEGTGENNALFSNSLPEQRFYNRTVTIDVSQSNTLASH